MSAASPAASAAHPLSRSARQMKRWQTRSRRVALARKLLPATIGLIVLVMLGFVVSRALTPAALTDAPLAKVMPNPRFYGQDARDRSFQIQASRALRKAAETRSVILNDPLITLGDTRVGARSAVYDEDSGDLTLQGEVALDDGAGTKLSGDRAAFDRESGVVSGSSVPGARVRAQGPFGDVTADSFQASDEGKLIVFRNVQGRLK